MNYYIECIQDGVKNRGEIIALPQGKTNLDLDYYGKGDVVDAYHSAFNHTKELADYVEKHNSVSQYEGTIIANSLYWDLDNDVQDVVIEDMWELYDRLCAFEKENIRVYFSGGKGFHIIYYCPELELFSKQSNVNMIVKRVCTELAKGLKSFDSKIYDKTRILRTPNSKHSKSGLYKIPIPTEKRLDIFAIKELAKEQYKVDHPIYNDIHNEDLLQLINEVVESGVDDGKKTGVFKVSELLEGITNGFSKGERNTGLCSIAGMLHNRNFDTDFIHAILTNINGVGSSPISETALSTIINSVSRYQVDDEYVPASSSDIMTMAEASKSWHSILSKSGYTHFGERYGALNKYLKMAIPGDVIAIVGSSGSGKTTVGMDIGNCEANHMNRKSMLASLEMSAAGVFFRAATIEAKPDEDGRVDSTYVAKTLIDDQKLRDAVSDTWKNTLIVDKGGMSIEKIREYFLTAQDLYGGTLSNLVIDYAQNIKNAEDITHAMRMAREFKTLAKELKTKLIVLMQTNKQCASEYEEIIPSYIEGAGAYRQACDYIIGIWKSRIDIKRVHCKIIKDRWGEGGVKFDLLREGLKYHTTEFRTEQASVYNGEGGRV